MLVMIVLLLLMDRACSAMRLRKRNDAHKESEQAENDLA